MMMPEPEPRLRAETGKDGDTTLSTYFLNKFGFIIFVENKRVLAAPPIGIYLKQMSLAI